MNTLKLEELSWPEIKESISKGYTTVVITIGAIEQHGPHLSVATDAIGAEYKAASLASRLEKTLWAPPIRVGCSDHHLSFFAISLRSSTLKSIIRDYVSSLVQQGFTSIVLIPCHGGNFKPVAEIKEDLVQEYPDVKFAALTDFKEYMDSFDELLLKFNVTKAECGLHSGEGETSLMLHLASHTVRKDLYAKGYTGEMGAEQWEIVAREGVRGLTENGVVGDPRRATAEKGKEYAEFSLEWTVKNINKQLGR